MSDSSNGFQFQLIGGHACLDFANSLDNRGSANEIELITRFDRLLRLAEQTGILLPEEIKRLQKLSGSPWAERHVVEEAHELREKIFEIFHAVAAQKQPPAQALERLNFYATEAAAHRMVAAESKEFAWKWKGMGDNPRSALWPFAWKAAELLTSPERELVRACASPGCDWLFLDHSKSHSRRWCDMKVCGNRSKARNFYRRSKASAR